MSFNHKIAGACAVFVGVALPAYANNPPRADGVLYLILVFPLIAIASHLAAVESKKGGWPGRIGRVVFFTLVIFFSAAGTGIGFLAMLVIMLYGLVWSLRIVMHGKGRRRFMYSALTLLGTVLAGVGYLWAMTSSSGPEISRSRQSRTIADMRAVGLAAMSWSMDHAEDEVGVSTPVPISDADSKAMVEATASDADAALDGQEVVFIDARGPRSVTAAELETYLVPDYIAEVPELDGWGQPLDYRFDPDDHRFQVRSGGADHIFDSDSYTSAPFDRTDFDRDIVYADGIFVRWPRVIGEGS